MILPVLATILSTVAPVSASTPNLQPAFAVSAKPGSIAALVFGTKGAIWFASLSADSGAPKPVQIAALPDLMLGRHRGPRVVTSGTNVVVTAIDGGDTGNLLAWHSADGGRSWSQTSVVINDQPHSAREGLHNIAIDSAGTIAAVWLDLREKGTRLYGAYSKDFGKTWSKNVQLYSNDNGTICQCCHPSITSDSQGKFQVMFRNVVNDTRDMYALRWQPPFTLSQPVKQGSGSWKINACPMDGGGIAEWNSKTVTAWRRDHEIYFVDPNSGKEQSLGQGKDTSLAVGKDGVYVAWQDPGGSVQVENATTGHKQELDSKGAFPVLGTTGFGVLAAWEHEGSIKIERLGQ